MTTKSRKKNFLTILLTLILSFIFTGFSSSEEIVQFEGESPILTGLQIDGNIHLRGEATLTCRTNSVEEYSSVNVSIELPEGVQLVEGQLVEESAIGPNTSVEISAIIRFDALGTYLIACRALTQIDDLTSYGDIDELFLDVGEENQDHNSSSQIDVPIAGDAEQSIAGEGEEVDISDIHAEESASVADVATLEVDPPSVIPTLEEFSESLASDSVVEDEQSAVAGTLTLKGKWFYFERNDEYKPMVETIVEIVRGDNRKHITWCYTDHKGAFTCPPIKNPGRVGVRAIAYSYTKYNPYGDKLMVINPNWGTDSNVRNTFGVQTKIFKFSDGVRDIGTWHVNNNDHVYERAFWAHQDLIKVWRFIWFTVGNFEKPKESAGSSTIRWNIRSDDGTYYRRGEHIHLNGSDPLSTSVVGHEYGHNMMYTIYGNWMPKTNCPSPHFMQRVSHQNCAWTEGWANFISIAANNDPIYRWASGGQANLETQARSSQSWDDGDRVEGRVAGALWDMIDSKNDGDDIYNGTFKAIWDTVYHQNDNNFAEFWSAYKSRKHPNGSDGPIMSLYQNSINYRSGPANDDFDKATTISRLPFTQTNLNTKSATTQGNDPTISCGKKSPSKQTRSVWYKYKPTSNQNIIIHTNGSNYDTVLNVWTGSFGRLKNVVCDNNSGQGKNAYKKVTLLANQTYYFEVAQYGSGNGGSMSVKVSKDSTKPKGSFNFNSGSVFTNKKDIVLNLDSESGGHLGVKEFRVRLETGPWSSWKAYQNAVPWTLNSKDGEQKISIQFKDYIDESSSEITNSIVLDTHSPTVSTLAPSASLNKDFAVSWYGGDSLSSIDYYNVYYRINDSDEWVDWLIKTKKENSKLNSEITEKLEEGDVIYIKVSAVDMAGNVSEFSSSNLKATKIGLLEIYLPIILGE